MHKALIWMLAAMVWQSCSLFGNQPNVILIFVDDLGYADLGFQGSDEIPTPHLDAFAESGIIFTNGYVSAPQCSPSRAGIITGRYQQRFGYEANPERAFHDVYGLPESELTIGNAMQSVGYYTGVIGEWDLGMRGYTEPTKRGFDEFIGFYGASRPYVRGSENKWHLLHQYGDCFDEQGVIEEDPSFYLTDYLTDRAIDFVDRRQNEPFFLYLAYHAPHWPLQTKKNYLDAVPSNITEKHRRNYAAIMIALDESVGQVMAKLEDVGLRENTLVFFISDNGGPTGKVKADGTLTFGKTTSKNDPFRGEKGDLYEGGIRVPFAMSWPGNLPSGKRYDKPVITLDVLPTMLAASGNQPLPHYRADGVNLLPYLRGQLEGDPHEFLYWRFMAQMAIREGEWKFFKGYNRPTGLFNLERDPEESENLIDRFPDVASRLNTKLTEWGDALKKPMWRTPEQLEQMATLYGNGMRE